MSARYTSPSQRDVIVGGCDAVPDISHFISEEIITTEIVPSRSPVRSYYGSCGEGSPGESSDDYLDDLIEIKEESVDPEEGTEELSVAVDLAKLRHVSKSSDSDSGRHDEEWVSEEDDYFGGIGDGILEKEDFEKDKSGQKRYVFLTKNGKPAETLDELNGQTVELADVYAKPKLSYAQLIAEALMSTEERMLTLAEIYTSVADRHPFYKMDHSPNWQNAIRHNLTLNKCFTKVPRPPSEGRGSFWRLEDGAEVTIFKRIVARHQNKVKQTHIHKYDPTNDIVYVTIPSE